MNIAANLPENKSSKVNKLYNGFKNTMTFTKNVIHVTKRVFML
jgi:hypothetical protein